MYFYLKIGFVVLFCLLILYVGFSFVGSLMDSAIENMKNRKSR
jgi:branched-subunit amino acid permease